jgi:hypothetical protein
LHTELSAYWYSGNLAAPPFSVSILAAPHAGATNAVTEASRTVHSMLVSFTHRPNIERTVYADFIIPGGAQETMIDIAISGRCSVILAVLAGDFCTPVASPAPSPFQYRITANGVVGAWITVSISWTSSQDPPVGRVVLAGAGTLPNGTGTWGRRSFGLLDFAETDDITRVEVRRNNHSTSALSLDALGFIMFVPTA